LWDTFISHETIELLSTDPEGRETLTELFRFVEIDLLEYPDILKNYALPKYVIAMSRERIIDAVRGSRWG
jgi:hypothetical protein